MIDPLDEPEPSVKIAELCEMLLNQAREDREKLNRAPFNWPADWNKDSSLETWFPLTAEELERIKSENARLTEALRVKEEEMEHLENTLNIRLNNHLCDMKPDFDDSIVGFNAGHVGNSACHVQAPSRRSSHTGEGRKPMWGEATNE